MIEAAWVITNITSGTTEHTKAIVRAGGVEALVGLLRREIEEKEKEEERNEREEKEGGGGEEGSGGKERRGEELIELAIWGLGNVAGDSIEGRNYVLERGGLEGVVGVIMGAKGREREREKEKEKGKRKKGKGREGRGKGVLRNGGWALSNMVRGKPLPEWERVECCLGALGVLLDKKDDEVFFFFWGGGK